MDLETAPNITIACKSHPNTNNQNIKSQRAAGSGKSGTVRNRLVDFTGLVGGVNGQVRDLLPVVDSSSSY